MKFTKALSACVFSLLFAVASSQSDSDFKTSGISPELTIKANAVVRYEKQTIEINDFDDMYVTTKRVVTVLNEYGDQHTNAFEGYDNNTKIKKMEAKIYNEFGKEIKKFKIRDFTDQSAVSGGTLYSDNRVKYLSYTPVKYPYTIEYSSEVQMKSTAFVPQWRPIDGYYVSVQYSEYELVNNSGIEIKTKTENFDNYNIEKLSDTHLKAKNLKGIKYEAYNPGISNIVPIFKTALTTFNMEGVKGINNSWEDFGKWMYNDLISGTGQIPQSVIDNVRSLTSGVTDNIEKAKIIYEFMQDKTRYISVQVGIGGWKPMNASEVDKLGYSDCKGLTNYTKALLEAVGVPSYYTVVWGDNDIKDIDSDFSVTEGNHVILCVPTNEENIFLECTSQTAPFGFTAGFTDDRDVLLVTPEGGKIVHTKVYDSEESLQITTAEINLIKDGSFDANVSVKTTGYQYAIHEDIISKSLRDQKLYYKEYWDNVNNLEIMSIDINNNRDEVILTENVKLRATNYTSKSGNRLIIMPNIFNRVRSIPPRYDSRNLDFRIQRGYKDVDEFIINLPEGVKVEAMTEGEKIESKFGVYEYKIEKLSNTKLKYSRSWTMNKGNYEKEDYNAFRDFRKRIVKLDKTKIVLKID
ncbi:uncharacterized protein DUF3857 [Winogradskyella wandonensis]|uniref:Uncharacterized protein DUF3857 n=1 Tax=Winogradskyella wandonensis TaxID=1442586 RepID=A0A4R1KQX3_9FLAO|nr:DUF3857 domain-containing transglutaminase family protein [Winogradskyella wandonensis]TCK67456.1 uncharacterized protein DUF3857 [Winogradskyella wandonensis]